MYTIKENKKGNGIVLFDSNGKVCFFDKKSKYYNIASNINNWEDKTLKDKFFKVVKEFERFNIVDFNEKYIIDNINNVVFDYKKYAEENYIDIKISRDCNYKEYDEYYQKEVCLGDGIYVKVKDYNYSEVLMIDDVIKTKLVYILKDNYTWYKLFSLSESLHLDREIVHKYLEEKLKEINEKYFIVNKNFYKTWNGSYYITGYENYYYVDVLDKKDYEEYLKIEKEIENFADNFLKSKNVVMNINNKETQELIRKLGFQLYFDKGRLWFKDTFYEPESNDGFRRGGYIDKDGTWLDVALAFDDGHKLYNELLDKKSKLKQKAKEIILCNKPKTNS